MTILHIDSSPRYGQSVSRQITANAVESLTSANPGATVIYRDVAAEPLPFPDADMIAAFYTPPADRTEAQRLMTQVSDKLTEEIKAADVVVVGVPMWNFTVPASLKAWIDLVARVGVTFKYGANGPEGLLENKRAIFAVATGGTPTKSDYDYVTGYLKTFFGFIGITQTESISADQIMGAGGEERVAEAKQEAAALA